MHQSAHGCGIYPPRARQGQRLGHPAVVDVAAQCERSPAQVLLRWGLQQDLIVLPKSTHAERIAQNAAVFDFELSPADMARLDALEEGLVTGWDARQQA